MLTEMRTLLREKLTEFNEWRALDGNYMYFYREILYQQGFWPALDNANGKSPSKVRYWYPRIVVASWVYFTVIGFPMVIYSTVGEPLQVRLEPVIFSFITALGVTTLFSLLHYNEIFHQMFHAYEMMRNCQRLLSEHPAYILGRRQLVCDVMFYLLLAAWAAVLGSIFGVIPYLIANKKFYARAWYPYDAYAHPLYELSLFGQFAMLVSTCGFIHTTAVLLGTLLAQAASHLQLLNHNMAAMNKMAVSRTRRLFLLQAPAKHKTHLAVLHSPPRGTEMATLLRSCVCHHQAVIRFVEKIEMSYNLIIGQYLVTCLIPSGLTIVSMQHVSEYSTATLIQLLAVLCIATSLPVMFHFADNISQQSGLLRHSVFSSDWLAESESFKRSMRIIMARSNHVLVVKVLWGIPMTLVTLRKLMYLTYKYSTFVREMNIKGP